MSRDIFLKKSIQSLAAEAAQKRHTFSRSLSTLNLMMIGLGAIVGTGLFVMTGHAAAECSGSGGTLIAFLIAGIIAVFAALCYAEFAALIPIAGSAYSYAYVTMGEFMAWILGWGMTIQYLITCAAVSGAWSGYFGSLLRDFGIHIPARFAQAPWSYHAHDGWQATGAWFNLPAVCIIAIIGFLISTGLKAATSINNIMVVLKIAVIVLFIACGVGYIQWDNFVPFIPENRGVFGELGWTGILRGAGILFFAYNGFDVLSTLTQETRNPQKDIPRGMLGSLSLCAIIYLLFSVVLLGLVSYTKLAVPDPIVLAIRVLGPGFGWLSLFVKVAILAGFTSVIMVMLLGQSRIFYTMAHDGLLPKKMGKIHDKTHVPLFTTIVITAVGAVIAGLFPVSILGQLVSMSVLLTYAVVCFAVLALRYKQPHLHRPFKVPFMPYIPLLGGIVCVAQMFMLPKTCWVQLFSWLAIGVVIYFTYSMKRSKLQLSHAKKDHT